MADDFSTSVETPAVSGGTGDGSVAPAASSGGVAETPVVGSEPTPAQSQPVTGAESAGATPGDEFPDDAAFQALPGEERGSQWQRARSRITELNNRVRELDGQSAQYAELGDVGQLKTDAELTRSLFGYAQDEQGNTLYDQQTGMPYISTASFQDQLQAQSPDTYYTMLWEATDRPIDQNGTVGDWILREKYGLDPQLVETYKQIQSPQDALRYAPQSVSSAELEGIPGDLHDAYKTFDAQDRYDLQQLFGQDEQRFLARLSERKQNLDNQKFIAEQRQRDEQVKQDQKQRWENTIRQNADTRGQTKWDTTVNSQLDKLKTQYQPFGPDDVAGNQMVYEDIISHATKAVTSPAFQQRLQAADHNYYLHEYYTATGNQMLAARALADAEKAALELQREFAKAATLRVEQWNQRFKNRSAAPVNGQSQQQNPNPANPPNPPAADGEPRRLAPGSFGLSNARKNELAAQLAMRKASLQG